MKTRKLIAAVIGGGMIANYGHIPAYQNLADEVVIGAVCDRNDDLATVTAKRHGIPESFTDSSKMLSAVQPDIVSICTPNVSHPALIREALEAGAHVICEKPLALDYSETKELFDLADKNGLVLVASQTARYNREYFAAKEYVEAGELGKLFYAEFNRIRRRGMPTWGTFHIKSASGGGAFADIGVHALDTLLWIMGSPQVSSVRGFASSYTMRSDSAVIYDLAEKGALAGLDHAKPFNLDDCDVEEFSSGSISTDGGININFKVAWAANLPNSYNFSIVGSKMGITFPEMKLYSTLGVNQVDISPRLFKYGEHDDKKFPGHYYLIENVINHILGREELHIKPEETLNVTAVLDLFYRSVDQNREVSFTELEVDKEENN